VFGSWSEIFLTICIVITELKSLIFRIDHFSGIFVPGQQMALIRQACMREYIMIHCSNLFSDVIFSFAVIILVLGVALKHCPTRY
jgi:hypothetical protein